MSANLENSAVATGLEKVSFHSNPKERQCQRMFKLLHNCTHLTHEQMPKILQARLQQYVNFQMFKLILEKAEKPAIKWPTSIGSSKKQESSSALLTTSKPLTVWITTNCGILLEIGTPDHLNSLLRNL